MSWASLFVVLGIPEPSKLITGSRLSLSRTYKIAMEDFHFGHLIQAELKAQGRTVTWFAKAIHCDRTNAYKIFNNSHIDSELLFRISRVLGHNFLLDAARYLDESM